MREALGRTVRERLVPRAVDREDAIEPGDLEDLPEARVDNDDGEASVVRAEPLDSADEHGKRRRVDEGRPAEVDDDDLRAFVDHAQELRLELRARVQVDLTCEAEDDGAGACLVSPNAGFARIVDSALYTDGAFTEDLKLDLDGPLAMNGRTVILQASRKIPRAIADLLARNSRAAADVVRLWPASECRSIPPTR